MIGSNLGAFPILLVHIAFQYNAMCIAKAMQCQYMAIYCIASHHFTIFGPGRISSKVSKYYIEPKTRAGTFASLFSAYHQETHTCKAFSDYRTIFD
jgi:hypothetical protein